MSRIDVEVGDVLKVGDPIGAIGLPDVLLARTWTGE